MLLAVIHRCESNKNQVRQTQFVFLGYIMSTNYKKSSFLKFNRWKIQARRLSAKPCIVSYAKTGLISLIRIVFPSCLIKVPHLNAITYLSWIKRTTPFSLRSKCKQGRNRQDLLQLMVVHIKFDWKASKFVTVKFGVFSVLYNTRIWNRGYTRFNSIKSFSTRGITPAYLWFIIRSAQCTL